MKHALFFLGILAAGAIGFLSGSKLNPSAQPGGKVSNNTPSKSTSRPTGTSPGSNTSSPANHASLADHQNFFQRLLNADSAQLSALWDELDNDNPHTNPYGKNVRLYKQSLLQQWALVDINSALDKFPDDNSWKNTSSLRTLISTLAETNPEKAWELANSLDSPQTRHSVQQSVLAEIARKNPELGLKLLPSAHRNGRSSFFYSWAEVDPDAALQSASLLPKSYRNDILASIIGQIGNNDPLKALQLSETLPRNSRKDATRRIISTWATKDPAAAATWASQNASNFSQDELRDFARDISKQDRELAFQWTEQHLTGRNRDRAIQSIVGTWLEESPQQATTWIKALTDPTEQLKIINQCSYRLSRDHPELIIELTQNHRYNDQTKRALQQAGSGMAQNDLNLALQKAELFTDEKKKQAFLTGVLEAQSQHDPQGAFAQISALSPGSNRRQLLHTVIQSLAQDDPLQAIQLADNWDNPQERYSSVTAAISAWSQHSPTEAAEYVQNMDDPFLKKEALSNLLSTWHYQDSEAAARFAFTLEPNDSIKHTIGYTISQWMGDSPDEAIAFLKTNATNPNTKDSFGRSLNSLASKHPEKALELLESPEFVDLVGTNHYRGIAGNWSNHDPAAAAQWVDTLTDEKARNQSISSVIDDWAESDPVAAAEWINTFDNPTELDTAKSTYAKNVVNADPEGAIEWALSINDPKSQENTLTNVLSNWRRYAPDQANTWLAQSGLPEDLVEKLSN